MMVLETFLIFLNALVSLNDLPEKLTPQTPRTEVQNGGVHQSPRPNVLARGGWDRN